MAERTATLLEIERFQQQGFVLISGLLAGQEGKHYGDAVDRAVADRTQHDHRSLEEKSRYEQSFQQCLNLWEDHSAVRPLSFHPRIGRAAAALLNAESVRVWHDQALYKEAGGRETDPHQDQPYWPISEARTVTAWIPFQSVRKENGAVGYMPGSHRLGLREYADIFTHTGLDLDAFPETRNGRFEYVDAECGDVVFHHGLTVHRAYPNTSDLTRRVHTVIYFADGCTRSEARHPSVDRPGVGIGEKIASDLTPVAWPRPPGDLPATPPPPSPLLPGWPGWKGQRKGQRRRQRKAGNPS